MKLWQGVLLGVVGLVVVAAGIAGWLVVKRPLTVYAWQTRLALASLGLERRSVASPAGRQCVFVGGSGPPVVLLHGAGDQAGTWSKVAGALLPRHTLIVPDLAGHGRSQPRTGPISAGAVLAGLEAVVEQLRGGQPVTVVGNSLGAWMAMLLAHRHPDWVATVVAINGGALTGSNQHARVLPRTRAEAREAMAQVRDGASPPVPDFVLDDVIREASRGPLARFAATAAEMGAFTLDGKLAQLHTPVHLVWGESDRLMPLDYAQRMRAELPQATLVTIPRCGHVPQVECPQQLLAVLAPLLEGPE